MNTPKSETTEVDAFINGLDDGAKETYDCWMDTADFARKLERERDALLKALKWALPRVDMTNAYPAVLGAYHHCQELIASIEAKEPPK